MVQGHAASAGLQDAEESFHIGRAIVREQSDAVAARDAEIAQAGCDAVGPRLNLTVRQDDVTVFQRDGVAAMIGALLEQRVNRCEAVHVPSVRREDGSLEASHVQGGASR